MNYLSKLIGIVCLPLLIITNNLQAGEIHDAAAAGDLNKVRALLEADSTLLESKDNDGNTPLYHACNSKQVGVANFLIDKGANVNNKNKYGTSPLGRAINGPFDLTKRLIDKGADVNSKQYNNQTPLHWIAYTDNIKVARLLIDHGADISAYDNYIGTVLHVAINLSPNDEMAKLLVESGAKLNQQFSFGNTELHLAAMKGYGELVKLLIDHGADVNAVNENGRTALYYAAKHGSRRAADALIAAGANKNAIVETNYGKAPQLTEKLREGEAYLWFLGGVSPSTGYAVKTKEHLLIFNPAGIDESLEAGLANGHLNPRELKGQNITALITFPGSRLEQESFRKQEPFKLAKRIPGVGLVTGVKLTDRHVGDNDIPPYHLAVPNESFSVGDIRVHTIPAYDARLGGGMGYLVEADGLKVFHAGFHASSNKEADMEKYRKEIDFLKSFGPIDIAILPIKGHVGASYEPYLYLLDQLSPKVVYLMADNFIAKEQPKCANVLRTRNIPVEYPDGGRAVGQRFHYLRK